MEDEVWMTVKEAALFTGVSVQTVYSWIRRGPPPVRGLDHLNQKVFRHLDVAKAELTTRTKAKRLLAPGSCCLELPRAFDTQVDGLDEEHPV